MKSLLLSLLLLQGCAPPAPPPIPPPVVHGLGAVALDDNRTPLTGATCACEGVGGTTNTDGYVLLASIPAGARKVTCSLEGYEDGSTTYVNDHDLNIAVVLKFINRLSPVHAEGQHFAGFTAIEASDFMLYQKFLDGENLTPVLSQRQVAGFNMVRVFGMVNGSLGHFVPTEYGDRYFASLSSFYRLLASYNLYGEFVAFADVTQVVPDVDAQVAHWSRLVNTFELIPNVLLEAVNEGDQTINHLASINVLPQPVNVFASHGSNGSQAWPIMPHWAYGTFHTNDAPEWPRKVGHNAMEIWGGPTLANENTRAPDRFNDTQQAFDAAAGAALLAAGSCYHSVNGKASLLWDAQELALAQAWAAGARSVPLTCRNGAYKHRIDLEKPNISRAYQRGDDPTCVVVIHQPQ
jgi:hypothetical protein